MKPILCLDFDGVIHSYTSGWKGVAAIPDPPVEGAFAFIEKATEHFSVAVYSSRSALPEGIEAMQRWFQEHGLPQKVYRELWFPCSKPAAFVTIDDRALTFTGVWPSMIALQTFKPWNKR